MRIILILLCSLSYMFFANAASADSRSMEEAMDWQLRKGAPAWAPPPPSWANSSEVRAAENALRKMCEGFDKVDAQNMFLPTAQHNELYSLHQHALGRDARAQAEFGDRYIDGREVPKDWKTGLCWYRAAAQNGSSYAEFWLGLFYQHGWVVKESAPVAAHWFTLAYRHRDYAAAERQVADRYANDDSGVYDMGKALVWYERAAAQRDLQAELALGNFYITSHESADIKRALSWYGKASAQHSVSADYNIGQIYYRGVGIPQDLKEAHKWLLRAAERGYKPAQYDLAEMYYRGIGVPEDWVKSYAWLEVSGTAENNPAAQDLEDMLVTHFNPKQLTEASHLARDYKARYGR
jgi:TPR repeat protein